MPDTTLDITLTEAKSKSEAMNFIFIGLKYFLINHTIKTVLVIMAMLFGLLYAGYQYYATDKVEIRDAVPLSEVRSFSIMPEALAATAKQEADDIIINGKIYGKFDTNYQIWKMKDKNAFLILDKRSGQPFIMDLSGVTKMQQQEERYRQMK